MEYLDVYDEQGNPLGKAPREIVHRDGLWHKTVHCWLYDTTGNLYFQVRAEEQTLYTTASGHVAAGESIAEAFQREIVEEIGVTLEMKDLMKVSVVTWKMDRPNKDGTMFVDRAFANVYIAKIDYDASSFHFDPKEVLGVIKVNAKDTLHLFETKEGSLEGEGIFYQENQQNLVEKRTLTLKDFLVNAHETAIGKYGDVLRKTIELTRK